MIYLELFWEFFKIGLFTFGGGYAMIPLVKEAVVDNLWLTEGQFYDFIGVCESTPGPIAINMATYVGSTQGGLLGSVLATLGVVLPSFVIIVIVASVLTKVLESRIFKNCLEGMKPVVMALILSAGITLLAANLGLQSIEVFKLDYISLIIFIIIVAFYFVLGKVTKKKIGPIPLILFSALLGIIICSLF